MMSIANIFSIYDFQQGIYVNRGIDIVFENTYLSVRDKEQRVYDDTLVRNFPTVPHGHPQYQEWALRLHTMQRVMTYLEANPPRYILDLGCGNGWFLGHIASAFPTCICIGMDVNKQELQQAARLFVAPNLYWVYDDIFKHQLPNSIQFDAIILNGCLQYFEKPSQLFHALQSLQNEGGEIHILDSPINKNAAAAEAAQARSMAYFKSLDAVASAAFYHHHTWTILESFSWRVLYRPSIWQRFYNRFFKNSYNPFTWVCIRK